MEIIQNKVIKKITTIMILIVMLIGIASPVFAAYTDEIKVGDTLQIKSGLQWNTYATKNEAKKTEKPKGKLEKNEKVKVVEKYTGDYANVLKIEGNRFIYYGPKAKDSFTIIKANTKTPAKTETKLDTPTGSGLLEIGGAVIGGILDVATSETTMGILSSIKDIIFGIIRTIIESIGNIGNASFDFPKTELPVVDVPSTSTEKVLKLNNTKATLDVGKTLILKATVDGKEVKPSYGSAKGSVATVDENGKITAKSAGTVEINAYYTYKNGAKNVDLKATCTVTVKAKDEKPSSGTKGITKTVTQDYINSLNKVNLSGYYGGGKYNITTFNDSNGAFGVQRSQLKYDNINKWYTYNGKIAVAAAMKRPKWVEKGYDFRNDIYHFNEFETLYIKINGTWYEAIVVDVCGVSMNPNEKSGNYYNDEEKTKHECQVIDIWTSGGFSNKYGVEVAIPR